MNVWFEVSQLTVVFRWRYVIGLGKLYEYLETIVGIGWLRSAHLNPRQFPTLWRHY